MYPEKAQRLQKCRQDAERAINEIVAGLHSKLAVEHPACNEREIESSIVWAMHLIAVSLSMTRAEMPQEIDRLHERMMGLLKETLARPDVN